METLNDPSKIMLSLSLANRNGNQIEIKNFVVDEETEEQEMTAIFDQFGAYCEQKRPLVITGYGVSGFDLPILQLKMRRLDNKFKKEGRYTSGFWASRDTLRRGYFLDLVDPVRFEIGRVDNASPKFVNLETAIAHKRFQHLPFKNTKHIVSDLEKGRNLDKWEAIHYLWENQREDFKKYIQGDVHDTLLLAEELFKT